MIKREKQDVIEHLKAQFDKSTAAICVDFRGINVDKITRFRQEIREASGTYKVVKNTLARQAVVDTRFAELRPFLVGLTGIIFCSGEAAESAKIIAKFAKGEESEGILKIKGGLVEGSIFDAAGIQQLSTLPPRQELLAQLVSSLQSPISGLVGTLGGIINEFVYTLQAVADQKADA